MSGFADKLKSLLSKSSEEHEYVLEVEGLKCEHCSARIVSVLNKLEGVEASADVAAKTVTVRTKKELDAEFIKETVAKIGDFAVNAVNKIR